MSDSMPTLHDVIRARPNVYRHMAPTPLYRYSGLSDLLGADVYCKHENHTPIGAFKVRGGLNLAAVLGDAEKAGGLFTASTGNHGQSIAYTGRVSGVPATIAVPEGANPAKVAAMRGLGAEVIHHGKDFDTAREWIAGVAKEKGGYFVGPTDKPLICGVGTYTLEIVEELPDVDYIFVPVGGGSGAASCSLVAKSLNPKIKVIACQSAQAPAAQRAWKTGDLEDAETTTFVEGVATRVPFANTVNIMRKYLDDFVLVDDAKTKDAMRLLIEHTRNLPEGAAGIPLAAALARKEELAGKKVVIVFCGGNLSMARLQQLLAQ